MWYAADFRSGRTPYLYSLRSSVITMLCSDLHLSCAFTRLQNVTLPILPFSPGAATEESHHQDYPQRKVVQKAPRYEVEVKDRTWISSKWLRSAQMQDMQPARSFVRLLVGTASAKQTKRVVQRRRRNSGGVSTRDRQTAKKCP